MASRYTFNAASPGIFTIGEPTRLSTDEEEEEEELVGVRRNSPERKPTEAEIRNKRNMETMTNLKIWTRYILIFSFIMSVGYTMFTTSCYDSDDTVTKYKSGFYYMTVLTGMLWINTITICALSFLSHLDHPFSFGVKFLLIWKFLVINLTTIFFVAAFFSFKAKSAHASNRFLIPLVMYCFYYILFAYAVFISQSTAPPKETPKRMTPIKMETFPPREKIHIEPLPQLSTLM